MRRFSNKFTRLASSWRWVTLVSVVAGTLEALMLLGQDVREISSSVVGLGGDPFQTLWRFNAYASALMQGSLDVSGEPFHNFSTLPWMPLHLLFGEPLAYNLVWLLQFPLAICAMLVLTHRLGVRPLPAALAGFLLAYAPYRIAQSLGHFGAMQLWLVPMTLAALHAWLERQSVTRLTLLTLLTIGTAWTEHTLFLTLALTCSIFAAAHWREVRHAFRHSKTRWSLVLALAVFTLTVVIPYASEVAVVTSPETLLQPSTDQRLRFTPALTDLVRISPFHLWRGVAKPYGTVRETVADHVYSPGVVLLIVGAAAFWQLWRRKRRPLAIWAFLSVGSGVLISLLPRLPGGNAVLDSLPLLSSVRTMDRFLAVPVVVLTLLAAIALNYFPRRLAVLVGIFAILEVLPAPFPAQSARVTPALSALTGVSGTRVLEAGSATDYFLASVALYDSSVHGKTIVGHNAFERVEASKARQELLELPGVGDLLRLRAENLQRPTFFAQDSVAVLREALQDARIDAVVVRDQILGSAPLGLEGTLVRNASPQDLDAVHTALRGAGLVSMVSSDNTTVYRVPVRNDPTLDYYAYRDEGWQVMRWDPNSTPRTVMRRGASFMIKVLKPTTESLVLALTLDNSSAPVKAEVKGRDSVSARLLEPGKRALFSLGELPTGVHRFSVDLDSPEITVENPVIAINAS